MPNVGLAALALALGAVVIAIYQWRHAKLQALREKARQQLHRTPLSHIGKELVKADIETCPSMKHLRTMIRLLRSSYEHDIYGTCLAIVLARTPTKLKVDDLTREHVELFTVLKDASGGLMTGVPKSGITKREMWRLRQIESAKALVAMENLADTPQLLPIIRDRGITDVQEALEFARSMKHYPANALSEGML